MGLKIFKFEIWDKSNPDEIENMFIVSENQQEARKHLCMDLTGMHDFRVAGEVDIIKGLLETTIMHWFREGVLKHVEGGFIVNK